MEVLLKYDGPDLKDHTMDVRDLAPALMAFGELCREANKVINGDKASVKVLINADIKANCITISIDVVQSIFEQAKSLVKQENVAAIKDILEWIGMLGGPPAGLLLYLMAKNRGQVAQSVKLSDSGESGSTVITIQGDGNTVIVAPETLRLAANKKVVRAAQDVLAPVANNAGIHTASFTIKDAKTTVIDKQNAIDICRQPPVEEEIAPQSIVGHIVVHSPIFDAKSKSWEFVYSSSIVTIDISETSIVVDALKRRKVVVGDTYKVQLEITEKKTEAGYKNTYKVLKVLDFVPGAEQAEMNFIKKVDDESKGSP